MNIVLWIVAAVLAVIFVAAGVMKMTRPKEVLATSGLAWVEDVSAPTVKAIGAIELLGALGLILPAAVNIAPVLVPLAATGLALAMLCAIVTHVRRREPQAIVINVVLLVLAALVAWGRFGPYAF